MERCYYFLGEGSEPRNGPTHNLLRDLHALVWPLTTELQSVILFRVEAALMRYATSIIVT